MEIIQRQNRIEWTPLMSRYFLSDFSESLLFHKLCSIKTLPCSSVLSHTSSLKKVFVPPVDSVDAEVVFYHILKESLPGSCFAIISIFFSFSLNL